MDVRMLYDDNTQQLFQGDDTELQYYLDYTQEQERYQQDAYNRSRYGPGFSQFEGIPEEAELAFSSGLPQWQGPVLGRLAEQAVLSWRVEKITGSQIGDLGQSMRAGSEIELKDFVKQRGGHKLEGLHKAAAHGDRATIMLYMKQYGPRAPINELDSNGCTPLMYAAMADSVLGIEMLLSFSARREKTDSEGRTAAHYAAFFGKHRALKFLIEAAADWTPRDVYGRTPLHWSAANRNTRCLSVLLKHASVVMGDINPRDNEDMTPIHCAAQFGRAKHIMLLNEAEADMTAVDFEGKTALHWTVNNPDTMCINALVEAHPPLINQRDMNGNTVLHLASSEGSTHIVDALLKLSGAKIDATNEQNRTALHLACRNNHLDTIQLLLANRALDSLVDADGLTALHYAIEAKSLAAVQVFVQLTDMTHLPNNELKTPLMMAAEEGQGEIVATLVQNRSVSKAVNAVDPNGRSALHLAIQSSSTECVTSLLSAGADPNLQDQLQQSPLFLAIELGHAECVQLLVSRGCQPDSRDGDGHTPLYLAVLHNQVSCVQALARSGANLNILDSNRDTALHMAAYTGNDQAAAALLEYGANPNIQNVNGWSPVHYAAMEGHLECLATFITHKAYANFMDFSEESYTPMDYALLNNHEDCVDILTQAGGLLIGDIRTMAAVSIQTIYRGYRARCELARLKKNAKAVTVITARVRGYLQRKRYREMKRRHKAAVLLQAWVRGVLQRVKFKVQLSQYHAQKHHYQLMVDYGQRVASDLENTHLKTFKREDFVASSEDLTVLDIYNIKEQQEAEKKLRLEKALQMCEMFLERQQQWREFREAEQRRRSEKAKRAELHRYANIVAQSKARREYSEQMFQQTQTVRSHTEAALVIQRAFRRYKFQRFLSEKLVLREMNQQRQKEERAVKTIQKAWRKYCENKLFQQLNFKKILTGPVISLKNQYIEPLRQHVSYQRGISITGNPRRRIHETEQSGFKLFRPSIRDLLFTPQSKPFIGSISGRSSILPTSNTDKPLNYLFSQQAAVSQVSSRQQIVSQERFKRQVKRGLLLPKLFIKDSTTTVHTHSSNSKTKLHLPNIVET